MEVGFNYICVRVLFKGHPTRFSGEAGAATETQGSIFSAALLVLGGAERRVSLASENISEETSPIHTAAPSL